MLFSSDVTLQYDKNSEEEMKNSTIFIPYTVGWRKGILRRTWDRPTFAFWIDTNLSVARPVSLMLPYYTCVQLRGRNLKDILMKFGTPTCFRSRKSAFVSDYFSEHFPYIIIFWKVVPWIHIAWYRVFNGAMRPTKMFLLINTFILWKTVKLLRTSNSNVTTKPNFLLIHCISVCDVRWRFRIQNFVQIFNSTN